MRIIIPLSIAVIISIVVVSYLVYLWINKPRYALEVDATRDTTDISGTMYRVRIVNAGYDRLTHISAELGTRDIQTKDFLDPGQTFYFYPRPDTLTQTIKITSNEGIKVITDYRSPTKVLGLPGGGR